MKQVDESRGRKLGREARCPARPIAGTVWFVALFLILGCARDTTLLRKEAEVSRVLGEAYMDQGNYTAALQELLKAEESFADDPQLQNDMGLVYLSKGRTDKAIGHFQRALRILPGYTVAMNNLGGAYLAVGRWEEAIPLFERVAADLSYPTPHYPLTNLGWIYYNRHDYVRAATYYQKALELTPGFAIALRGLGRTYTAMGRLPEAVRALQKAVENAPGFAEAYWDLAQAHKRAGDYSQARAALDQIVRLLPGTHELSQDASRELGRLREER